MKPKQTFLLVGLSLSLSITHAQDFKTLDVNNISATFNNSGSLFWDQTSSPQFEAPKGNGIHSIFASALWVGGLDSDSSLRLAASRFNQPGKDFYPGPVMDSMYYASEQPKFDRIFTIRCSQIDTFLQYLACLNDPLCDTSTSFAGYTPPLDILDYPGNGDTTLGQAFTLAPFVDVNANGVYEPFLGDYPYIERGDVMLYFMLNDDDTHGETGGKSMKLEVHVQAYAYQMSFNDGLNHSVFVHYTLINRSTQAYQNCFTGIWTDFDLGNYNDDYIGCAPKQNMYFAYNGDAFDETSAGALGYENLLAAQGVVFLNGPYLDANGTDDAPLQMIPGLYNGFGFGDGIVDNERLGMSSFMYYNNSGSVSATNAPTTDPDFYNYMQSTFKDGSKAVFGGTGYTTGCNAPFSCVDAAYVYTGIEDPIGLGTGGLVQPEIWDESTSINAPGDRRGIGAMGPFTFLPGQSQHVELAYVFARLDTATSNPYNAVEKLKQYVQGLPTIENLPKCSILGGVPLSVGKVITKATISVMPNPSTNGVFTIISEQNIPFEVLDMYGKVILKGVTSQNNSLLDISFAADGMYILKTQNYSQKLLISK